MKNFYFLLLFVVSIPAMSGEQYGKVSQIIVRGSDGLHYFWLEGGSSGKPQCSKNTYEKGDGGYIF